MDGIIHRQLNRIYRRECHAGARIFGHNTLKQVQYERINCESEDIISYAPDEKLLPGVYIAAKCLQPDVNEYFEVEVIDCGASGDIAVGLVPTNHPLDQLPGFVAGSVGYHAGDGRIYFGHQRGTVVANKCESGDRIGCGLRFENPPPNEPSLNYGIKNSMIPPKMRVYFTLNGSEIGSTIITPLLLRGGLFPAIALCSPGEEVKLNLNLRWTPSLSQTISDESVMCIDSYEDDWMRLHDIRLNGNILEYSGRGKSILDVGLAQARHSLDTRFHYFDIEIIDPGESCYIAIGLTRKEYPRHSHPGWNKGSIAYHADDGKIFIGSGAGDPFGPRCHRGDIMGCGIIFPNDFVVSPSHNKSKNINTHRSNTDDTELIYQYSSSEEPEHFSQSSHSGAENDESDDSDENSDYIEDDGFDLIPFPNDMIPLKRQAYYRRNIAPMPAWFGLQPPLHVRDNKRIVPNPDREDKGAKVEVFFTRNGVIIGQRQICIPKGGFYPTVGMLSTAEKVKVDLHPLTG